MVSKNIVIFLHLIKEELKLKEEQPWLSRTSTLETIPNLNLKRGEVSMKVKLSLLWQVRLADITINNATQIKFIQLMSHISEICKKETLTKICSNLYMQGWKWLSNPTFWNNSATFIWHATLKKRRK